MFRYHLWIPAVIASVALITSFASGLWCQTIKFEAVDSANPTVQFGPWYRQTTELVEVGVGGETYYTTSNGCTPLKDEDYDFHIDAKWKSVRAFTVIVVILGGFLTFVLYLAPCFYRLDASQWKSLAFMSIFLLTTFQGLVFLLLQSNLCTENPFLSAAAYADDCQWDQGMTANVVSTICWFGTGVVMLVAGVPVRPPRPPVETQTVTYQQTTNPVDGTTTVAPIAVVKGVAVEPVGGEEQPQSEVPVDPEKV